MIDGTKKQAPLKIDNKDISEVASNIEKMAKFYQLDGNVHTYTGEIGKFYKNCFMKIDDKYQFSTPGNFEETVSEILKFCKNDTNVKAVLGTIAGSKGKIEAETGLNVQELLIKTWQLGIKSQSANARELIIYNLQQNRLMKGGCLAGIAGRLVLPYSHFVLSMLEKKAPAKTRSNAARKFEEDTQIALALSFSMMDPVTNLPAYQRAIDTNTPNLTEEEALNLAIKLSKMTL